MRPRATTLDGVRRGVHRFGVAQGPKKLMRMEEEAAQLAIRTGVYCTWRSGGGGGDCARVGPRSRCFCVLTYADHGAAPSKSVRGGPHSSLVERPSAAGAAGASCTGFAFVPSRPEEIGEHWLTRRRGFNVNTWCCKCQCGHTHEEHHPASRQCRACGCSAFRSNFLCVVCNKHWEDHKTVFESESERKALGLPTGRHFMPLASTPDIRRAVFRGTKSMAATAARLVGRCEHVCECAQVHRKKKFNTYVFSTRLHAFFWSMTREKTDTAFSVTMMRKMNNLFFVGTPQLDPCSESHYLDFPHEKG